MTSSARATSATAIVRPKARAAFRLMTSFELDGLLEWCVGRISVLRMRSKKWAALRRHGCAACDHMTGVDGEAMFRHACAIRLEGIVTKRLDSRYKSGRCLSWGKVKNP
jgi:hypothetical protein